MPSKEQRRRAREKNGIPEGLTEEFVDATYVVLRATDFAISKAIRNDMRLLDKYRKGRTAQVDNKVRLTPRDVEKLEKAALSYMPYSIKQCSQGAAEYSRVLKDATKIFNDYGDEKQMEKIKNRLPKVLGSACVFPEPEA